MKSDGTTRVIWVAIYAKAGHPLFVLFYQIWCMYGIGRLPSVVALWVSFPLDQELESFVPSEVLVCLDGFHFIFFFPFNKVRWWLGEVWAMCGGFAIGQ